MVIGRIVARSPYRSAMRLLGRASIESTELVAMKARVMAVGGMWEQLLGGILIVHLPVSAGLDPRKEIDRVQPPGP